MRILRALDAATTAFVQQLWPVPDAVFTAMIDESDYTVDVENGVLTSDKPLTAESKEKIRDAYLAARAEGVFEPPLTADELVAVRQLIEERFPASVAPVMPTGVAADGPASCEPSAAPEAGHPNLTTYELYDAARAARAYAEQGDPLWLHLADRLEDAAEQTK